MYSGGVPVNQTGHSRIRIAVFICAIALRRKLSSKSVSASFKNQRFSEIDPGI